MGSKEASVDIYYTCAYASIKRWVINLYVYNIDIQIHKQNYLLLINYVGIKKIMNVNK